jgi:hypothetical protein
MVNELSARVFDLRLVCVSPYRPAACDKAALRGLTHDRTRSSPAPSKDLLHRRGHPHMTAPDHRRRRQKISCIDGGIHT